MTRKHLQCKVRQVWSSESDVGAGSRVDTAIVRLSGVVMDCQRHSDTSLCCVFLVFGQSALAAVTSDRVESAVVY